MALKKGIESLYGIEFSYHKVVQVRILSGKDGVQLRIVTASWRDKQARIEGRQPIVTENVIENASFALTPFYALLKAKFPDFSEAEDDWETFARSTRPTVCTQQTSEGKLISRTIEEQEDSDGQVK